MAKVKRAPKPKPVITAPPDMALKKVETVTQAPTPPDPTPKQRSAFAGDPMWNARRLRIDGVLVASFGLVGISMYQGPAMAQIVVPSALFFAGGIMAAYLGVAEWGRTQGVMGTSVTTATSTAVSTTAVPKGVNG